MEHSTQLEKGICDYAGSSNLINGRQDGLPLLSLCEGVGLPSEPQREVGITFLAFVD